MPKSKDKNQVKPIKERYLANQQQENIYLTFALSAALCVLSILLLFVYFVGLCQVDGGSMNDTLENRQWVLINNHPLSYEVDDIVTCNVEINGTPTEVIKRIVAVGGDEVAFALDASDDSIVRLWRKNKETERWEIDVMDEKRIKEDMKADNFNDKHFKIAQAVDVETLEANKILVDEGMLLLLGDNRNNSDDSREFGLVPVDKVDGKMFYGLQSGSVLERLLLLIYGAS